MSNRRRVPADPEMLASILVPNKVTVAEIAAALACIVRFAGNTRTEAKSYSVAQHSVIVADHVMRMTGDPLAAVCALAHDAHEWRLGDIPTFVGTWLARASGADHLSVLKAALDARIYTRLGLPWPLPAPILVAIHEADQRAFMTELRDVADPLALEHGVTADPLPTPIARALSWPKAEELFLNTWDRFALLAGVPSVRRG